jgi:uncharacterized protein YcbK (DUF882 family)
MIRAYNLLKDDKEMYIGEYFKLKEFACSDGSPVVFIDSTLIDILDFLRKFLGKPIVISSGYRTCKYNSSLENSSETSMHMVGQAVDITFSEIVDDRIKQDILQLAIMLGIKGVGIADTYLHLDLRDSKEVVKWEY